VSLSSGDEVPHIFTRKLRLRPGEFLITSAKRLLQQYLPQADSCIAAKNQSIDHLVGAHEEHFGDSDPEGFRGPEVNNHIESRRALDGQVSRLGAS
jgi:hypothetical protein